MGKTFLSTLTGWSKSATPTSALILISVVLTWSLTGLLSDGFKSGVSELTLLRKAVEDNGKSIFDLMQQNNEVLLRVERAVVK